MYTGVFLEQSAVVAYGDMYGGAHVAAGAKKQRRADDENRAKRHAKRRHAEGAAHGGVGSSSKRRPGVERRGRPARTKQRGLPPRKSVLRLDSEHEQQVRFVRSAVTQVVPLRWSRVMECGYAREYQHDKCTPESASLFAHCTKIARHETRD
jgi:hypothetical protein